MKVAWATDIHLNFITKDEAAAFCERIVDAEAQALLLGGDIAEALDIVEWMKFLEKQLAMPIYFVLGNHDYYASDVASVQQDMVALQTDLLRWLPRSGVVPLGGTTALVGTGGWGDARLGNFENSRVVLSDFLLITDLRESAGMEDPIAVISNREPLRRKLNDLGDASALALRPDLEQALQTFEKVIVLTHVPPFREACWHEGQISNDDWLPFFTCKAIGDMLSELALAHPQKQLHVLCGHTHGSGEVQIHPNLKVTTGEAVYGNPDFRMLDLDA